MYCDQCDDKSDATIVSNETTRTDLYTLTIIICIKSSWCYKGIITCLGPVFFIQKCVIKRHPEVLMLLLKRFEFDYRYMTYVKINRTVDVPCTLQIPEV